MTLRLSVKQTSAGWTSKITENYRDAAADTHLLYLWQIAKPQHYGENSLCSSVIADESESQLPSRRTLLPV
jgi:hypothetical protein